MGVRHASGLLAVAGQEVTQALNGFREVSGPRQGNDPQMIRRRPVETGALGDQDLLLQQEIEYQLLVVDDVVHLGGPALGRRTAHPRA